MRLTSAQRQLYNMEIFAGDSIGVICGTVLFDKIYDINEMKRAINEVYKINESLRTRIKVEDGEPVQYEKEYTERFFLTLAIAFDFDIALGETTTCPFHIAAL